MGEQSAISESAISYVLIIGLISSVVIEVVGMLAYYAQSGGFSFGFTPQWQVTGQNFFIYTFNLLGSMRSITPTTIMVLGIVLLMLTSYARVFVTFLHFAFVKNPKYAVISLAVFMALTLTLLGH